MEILASLCKFIYLSAAFCAIGSTVVDPLIVRDSALAETGKTNVPIKNKKNMIIEITKLSLNCDLNIFFTSFIFMLYTLRFD
jgi:hypothetical protein